jgi:ABC-type glycerol-3-phosphate transport system substrate-binding protein
MKKFILVLFLVGILLVSGVFTTLAAGAPVTITWWHIQTAEAEKVLWQRLADE